MNWRPLFPSEHRAKAEVYQEFADDFRRLSTVYKEPKEHRRDASRRVWMRLALCDPLVRDGLWDALNDADEHWKRQSFDPPREKAEQQP